MRLRVRERLVTHKDTGFQRGAWVWAVCQGGHGLLGRGRLHAMGRSKKAANGKGSKGGAGNTNSHSPAARSASGTYVVDRLLIPRIEAYLEGTRSRQSSRLDADKVADALRQSYREYQRRQQVGRRPAWPAAAGCAHACLCACVDCADRALGRRGGLHACMHACTNPSSLHARPLLHLHAHRGPSGRWWSRPSVRCRRGAAETTATAARAAARCGRAVLLCAQGFAVVAGYFPTKGRSAQQADPTPTFTCAGRQGLKAYPSGGQGQRQRQRRGGGGVRP